MVGCIHDESKRNQVLPIGGPGPALSAREQGEMLFRALNKPERMLSVPIALMDAPIAVLDALARVFPGINDTAEFGRIGRYYASESMLVWDEQKQCYDADAMVGQQLEPTAAGLTKAAADGAARQGGGMQQHPGAAPPPGLGWVNGGLIHGGGLVTQGWRL